MKHIPHKSNQPRRSKSARRASKLAIESLESRQMMTVNLFLDFGDSYPLDATTDQHLFDVASIGAEANAPAVNFPAGTFRSLGDALIDRGIDYNSDNTVDAWDAIDLGSDVLDLVKRYYEPFDVKVQVVSSQNFDDVMDRLNDSSTHDAYVLFGGDLDFNGLAQVDAGNTRDNVCFAFTDELLDKVADQREFLAMALAHTAAHEAGHTFGLSHLDESPTADETILATGDTMHVDDALRHRKLKIFSRFDLSKDGGGTQNNFQMLAGVLGLRSSAPGYVTGTGAHDLIKVRGIGNNQAEVTVRAFRNTGFPAVDLIASTTYTINVANGVLVEAGFGDDRVEIENLTVPVILRGGQGNDSLFGGGGGDTLQGDHGNDVLSGLQGDDTYLYRAIKWWDLDDDTVNDVVAGGTDTLDFSGFRYAVSIDLASTQMQSIEQAPVTTTLVNGQPVEVLLPILSFNPHLRLLLGPGFQSTLTTIEKVVGSQFSDVIRGNALANTLLGLGGNDRLEGRGGNDTLTGGIGNDAYVFAGSALGIDTVNEFVRFGTDTLDFTGFSQAITRLDLALLNSNQTVNANNLVLRLAGNVAVENVLGTAFADLITGNSLNNVLVGNGGNDTLSGLAGRDLLIGGMGADILDGGEDDDLLIGGRTTHDSNLRALDGIMAEWGRTDLTYRARINHLTGAVLGGNNGTVRLNASTVLNDNGAVDRLTGRQLLDWFFTSLGDVITDRNLGGTETETRV